MHKQLLYPAFQNSSLTEAAKAGSMLCLDPDTISFSFRVSKCVCDLAAKTKYLANSVSSVRALINYAGKDSRSNANTCSGNNNHRFESTFCI